MNNTLFSKSKLCILVSSGLSCICTANAGEYGDATLDLNLRYESVQQDNALKDASALTLRTKLTYVTKQYDGFSAVVEFEDSRQVLGVNSYNDTQGNNTNYSIIADPETTELDQAFVQYRTNDLVLKFGRQVITLDDHRYVGHVAWRQDKQTFDAVTLSYNPSSDVNITYAYIDQRNRIFAETRDLKSKDHLINASYKTKLGKLTAYGYLLEVDNDTENSLDTYGIRFAGAKALDKTKLLYHAEYATQTNTTSATEFDTSYMRLEGGAVLSGITVKIGYELLGSDNGADAFQTPLATLHKFNGWADQFLGTPSVGLSDVYASVGTSVLGGNFTAIYHDFSADESTNAIDDLGSEINLLYVKKLAKRYTLGLKYANYSAGDAEAGKVDTDKVWVWLGAKF